MQATSALLILTLKCHSLVSVSERCMGVWEGEIAWVWVSENINHFLSASVSVFVCKSIHSAAVLKGSLAPNCETEED